MDTSNEFSLSELVDLLERHKIYTIDDLRDILGDETEVDWPTFKTLLSRMAPPKKITLEALSNMVNDAKIMIPDPEEDPPK